MCLLPDFLGVIFFPLFLFLSFFLLFFDQNEAIENTQFNNAPLSQTFRRFFLYRNLSSCGVFVRCMSSAHNGRRMWGRIALCKLRWRVEVQGIGSVDVCLSLESS